MHSSSLALSTPDEYDVRLETTPQLHIFQKGNICEQEEEYEDKYSLKDFKEDCSCSRNSKTARSYEDVSGFIPRDEVALKRNARLNNIAAKSKHKNKDNIHIASYQKENSGILSADIVHRSKITSKNSSAKQKVVNHRGSFLIQSSPMEGTDNLMGLAKNTLSTGTVEGYNFGRKPSRLKNIAVQLIKDSDEIIRDKTDVILKTTKSITIDKADVFLKPMKTITIEKAENIYKTTKSKTLDKTDRFLKPLKNITKEKTDFILRNAKLKIPKERVDSVINPIKSFIPKNKANLIINPIKSMIPKLKNIPQDASIEESSNQGSNIELQSEPIAVGPIGKMQIRETDIEVECCTDFKYACDVEMAKLNEDIKSDKISVTGSIQSLPVPEISSQFVPSRNSSTSSSKARFARDTVTPAIVASVPRTDTGSTEHEREILVKMLQNSTTAIANSSDCSSPAVPSPVLKKRRDALHTASRSPLTESHIHNQDPLRIPDNLQARHLAQWDTSPRRGPSIENLDTSFSNASDYYLNMLFEDSVNSTHSQMYGKQQREMNNYGSPMAPINSPFYTVAPNLTVCQDIDNMCQHSINTSNYGYPISPGVAQNSYDTGTLQYLDLYSPCCQTLYSHGSNFNRFAPYTSNMLGNLIAKQNELLMNNLTDVYRRNYPNKL